MVQKYAVGGRAKPAGPSSSDQLSTSRYDFGQFTTNLVDTPTAGWDWTLWAIVRSSNMSTESRAVVWAGAVAVAKSG
jgi:hypothetical protein